ncbi:MAG: hypothetical protein V4671_28865 [Armatimonadota bacterium]
MTPEEIAAETTDANRRVMLVTTPTRTPSISTPPGSRSRRSGPAPGVPTERELPARPLPTLGPGVFAVVALLFFGLVWIGRWVNAPQKPTHPVVAPISVVKPDSAEAARLQRKLEAKEKQDLREAEAFADGLRAQSASDQLQAHLRNSQAPPPSMDPKPYDVIQVYPSGGR